MLVTRRKNCRSLRHKHSSKMRPSSTPPAGRP